MDITIILLSIILPILTAIGGIWQAKEKGEKLNWAIFAKTIVIGLVAAGLLNATEADAIVQVVSTEIITYVLDQLVNAIVNKTARTAPTT